MEQESWLSRQNQKSVGGPYYTQRSQAEFLITVVDRFCEESMMPRLIMVDFNSVQKAGAPPVLCAVGYPDCSTGDDAETFVKFDGSKAKSGAKRHLNWIFARGASFDDHTIYV